MADADLKRVGQIKGTGGSWAAGASAQDGYRALFLKLGSAEVLSAFEEYCCFKGKTKERNIRGGKSQPSRSLVSNRPRTTSPAAKLQAPPTILRI